MCPQIIAWKCPHTGALFGDHSDYKRHLNGLSRERVRARNWANITDTLEDTISKIQQVNNMQEWCDYFLAHQKEFIVYGALNNWPSNDDIKNALEKGWVIKLPKLTRITIESKWKEIVSNSHNCPRNGYTNWGGRNRGDCHGYPGWHGRVSAYYKDPKPFITIKKPGNKRIQMLSPPGLSDMTGGFSNDKSITGLNCGSGGGRGGGRYVAFMFQEDFPNMEAAIPGKLEEMDKDIIWRILKSPNRRHEKDFGPLNQVGCGEAVL